MPRHHRWVVCATDSQGGGAAAAVAELDADDFRELRLGGAALMSPGVTQIALKNPVGMAAALKDPSVPPDSHLVMVLAGTQAANPSTLSLSDVFTPLSVQIIRRPGTPSRCTTSTTRSRGCSDSKALSCNYVDAVKKLGGTVEVRAYPADDHFSLPQSCAADVREWLAKRLG